MKDYIRRIDDVPKARFSLTWDAETFEMMEEARLQFHGINRSEFIQNVFVLGMKAYLNKLK